MALIIELNRDVDTSQEIAGNNGGAAMTNVRAAAEVILFPGVRYERWEEGQARVPRDDHSEGNVDLPNNERDWLEI